MPVVIKIDVERKLCMTVCSGIVGDEDFLQARKDLLADPRFDPSFDRLWDFSAVTEEHVSEESMAHLVATSPVVGDVLRAVVASRSPRVIARVMQFVSQSRKFNRRIAIFPSVEAAERWIERERGVASSAQD